MQLLPIWHFIQQVCQVCRGFFLSLGAAIMFYTCIPMPRARALDFQGVSRLAPVVGLLIGAILGLVDSGLAYFLGIPALTRSTLVVVSWIGVTGGLHLDGVMDTADGLAVADPQRRLQVMADSATGAFGAMAALAVVLLKIAALTDIHANRWFVLMAACGWGRWGQQVAIVRYKYLKPTGKGAFHKAAIRSPWDLSPGFLLLLSFSGLQILLNGNHFLNTLAIVITGSGLAILTGAWFNYKLNGHTGDTYGAVVEWTEALFLCLVTSTKIM